LGDNKEKKGELRLIKEVKRYSPESAALDAVVMSQVPNKEGGRGRGFKFDMVCLMVRCFVSSSMHFCWKKKNYRTVTTDTALVC